MRRRELLIIGGVVGTAVAIPPILRRIPSDFEFQPLPGFPGFRRLQSGSFSGRADPFFGLVAENGAVSDMSQPDISPCLALFGPMGWENTTVPVAVFSDFNCPYCKILEQRLIDMRDGGHPIRLIWHEMPLLGPSSMRFAQAVVAAGFLGAGAEARTYLSTRPLRPGPTALRALAEAVGIPADALIREVGSPRVAEKIAQSTALGKRLGIPGTPGTMIGRTLVIGAIPQADLSILVRLEAAEPQTVCV